MINCKENSKKEPDCHAKRNIFKFAERKKTAD